MEKYSYLAGYECANEFPWNTIPVEFAVKIIDGYKRKAVEQDNEFFAGLAQGGWEITISRSVSA